MRERMVILGVVLALVGVRDANARATRKFDTPPSWLQKPTPDQVMAVYPTAAMDKGKDGETLLRCWVKTDGLLRDCLVRRESPRDLGFGAAALALVPKFLMNPALKNGEPVESEVEIPIHFKLVMPPRSVQDAAKPSA